MNKFLILTAVLALQSCATNEPEPQTADDQNIEYFECKDFAKVYWDNIIVKLAAVPDEKTGGVLVAGVEYLAIYTVEGIERIWLFGDLFENGQPSYFISLKPNGTAHYFDLTEASPESVTVQSSATFECRPTN